MLTEPSDDDLSRPVPPTLTDVVARPLGPVTPGDPVAPTAPVWDPLTEPVVRAVVDQALHDLQQRVDQMVDYRVREALNPILSRMSEQLVRDVHAELSRTLHDVVTRAVTQTLARRRLRGPGTTD